MSLGMLIMVYIIVLLVRKLFFYYKIVLIKINVYNVKMVQIEIFLKVPACVWKDISL